VTAAALVRQRARIAALLLSLMAALPMAARAQGTVTGRITLVERGGAGASDVDQAVVYLEAAPTVTLPPWPSSSEKIAMRGREFLPHVRVVAAGGEVAFPNQDPYSHNVFSNTALAGFDLGLYRRGTTRSARFERAGVYPIYCNIHHRMVSFVVAVPNAYAARPGADGAFVIRGVPAGGYTLHAWHERAGEWAQPVVVVAGGSVSVRVELDARQYAPEQHLNKFGLPYTATRADRY
jgi:plastocyanin